jgi:hypothetical protein
MSNDVIDQRMLLAAANQWQKLAEDTANHSRMIADWRLRD